MKIESCWCTSVVHSRSDAKAELKLLAFTVVHFNVKFSADTPVITKPVIMR